MSERDTSYQAPWVDNLRHRPDPNRLAFAPGLEAAAINSAEWQSTPVMPPAETAEQRLPYVSAQTMPDTGEEPSYYDVSPLKKPVWKWQIASYFFLGGLSAGAYLIARAAERAGGGKHRAVTRAGTWLALATILPCPALLISDLGDPKRFHHMLRVFKPASPMNLGTWMLTGFSGALVAATGRELLRDVAGRSEDAPGSTGALAKLWINVPDLVGIPLAIVVAGYTGVLLSCTSNPLWCKNSWLGPLFSASSLSTGAEAISLVLDSTQSADEVDASQIILQRIDTAAHIAEAASMIGFQSTAVDQAASLKRGQIGNLHRFAIGALIASEVLKVLPVHDKLRKPVRMLAAVSGLAAGFALRWAMVYGGKQAADDPHTARLVSRPARQRHVARHDGQTPSAHDFEVSGPAQ